MADDIFLQLANLAKTSTFTVEESIEAAHDYISTDEMIVPDIKPKKAENGRPTILVIDDDFSTIDLMKIYLQRDYEYVAYANPKEAIFYLNNHIPDLIFIDSYLTMINTRKVMDIICSYKELSEVPIYYLCDSTEIGAITTKLPSRVKACISRPVNRGELQAILDVEVKVK